MCSHIAVGNYVRTCKTQLIEALSHTNTHAYKHTLSHTFTYTHTNTHTHTHTFRHMHTNTLSHIHSHTTEAHCFEHYYSCFCLTLVLLANNLILVSLFSIFYIRTCVHVFLFLFSLSHTHTYIHTYIHEYMPLSHITTTTTHTYT